MSKQKYIFQVPPTLYGELEELKYKADKCDKQKEVLDKLVQENEQLKNNWNELKKWLEEEIDYCSGTDNMDFISMKNAYESTMLEMQELEGSND